MAVPRNRLSNARRNIRRAHDSISPRQILSCSKCGLQKLPHRACTACGHYDERRAIRSSGADEE